MFTVPVVSLQTAASHQRAPFAHSFSFKMQRRRLWLYSKYKIILIRATSVSTSKPLRRQIVMMM